MIRKKNVCEIGFLHYVELPIISSGIKFLVYPTYLGVGACKRSGTKKLSASAKLCSQIQVPVYFAVPSTT